MFKEVSNGVKSQKIIAVQNVFSSNIESKCEMYLRVVNGIDTKKIVY